MLSEAEPLALSGAKGKHLSHHIDQTVAEDASLSLILRFTQDDMAEAHYQFWS